MVIQTPGWEDTLMQYKDNYVTNRLEAELTIDGKKWKQVGLRYKGHSSYFNFAKEELTKLPFNIVANYIIKEQTFEDGIKKIKLSNNYRDLSYVREMLSRQIVNTYIPMPKMAFAEVYVNQNYLGLYTMIEAIEEPFLNRAFGEGRHTLIKCDPDWKAPNTLGCKTSDKSSLEYLGENIACYKKWYELKSKKGWSALIDLTRVLKDEPENIEDHLDVYTTLWMLALNNTLVNLDSYTGALCHNYYLQKSENGVFMPLIWDLNLSFGGFQSPGNIPKIELNALKRISPYLHFKNAHPSRPLITQLLGQSLYRKVYASMIKTILKDYFENDQYFKMLDDFQSLIAESVKSEQSRIYGFEDFYVSVNETVSNGKQPLIGITELMSGRSEYLLKHPVINRILPGVKAYRTDLQVDTYHIDLETRDAESVWIYFRSNQQSTFQKKKMDMRDMNNWYSPVPADDIKEFFFVLENEKAASLYPKHAPNSLLKMNVQ
jgi:hypothetical protein